MYIWLLLTSVVPSSITNSLITYGYNHSNQIFSCAEFCSSFSIFIIFFSDRSFYENWSAHACARYNQAQNLNAVLKLAVFHFLLPQPTKQPKTT